MKKYKIIDKAMFDFIVDNEQVSMLYSKDDDIEIQIEGNDIWVIENGKKMLSNDYPEFHINNKIIEEI